MTVSLQIDKETAEALQAQADASGMTLEDYLRSIALAREGPPDGGPNGRVSAGADFDALLDQFFAENPGPLPSLPADFSRADLYADHD